MYYIIVIIMNEEKLIKYYNKFNEDKRLTRKHAKIEYLTSIYYLEKYLNKFNNPKIIDIGAGTGAYSLYLFDKGFDVTAVELVKHNLKVIQSKNKNIKSVLGNATNLNKFKDNTFDITILFGPMYHLLTIDEKIKALNEAKRITKTGGYIFISYCMNEYAIIKHGFIDGFITKSSSLIDENFKIIKDELYSYVRLEDIDYLKDKLNLKRSLIISQDGPAEYLKKEINKMTEEEFNLFLNYHLKTCERPELLGAGRHILDILKKV